MINIDADVCTSLLRETTDRIAAMDYRPDTGAPLPSIIDWVRRISDAAGDEMRRALAKSHPSIDWAGEDGRSEDRPARYWIFDPVDGAYHFLQRLPLWSSSLTLVEHGRATAALVYDPALGEMFVAHEGMGATLNNTPVWVSDKTDLASSVMGTTIAPLAQVGAREHQRALASLDVMAPQVFVVRQMASTSLQLAYVAAGRLDGYWENGRDAPDWLGGGLLVQEAGGIATSMKGDALDPNAEGIIAASPLIHHKMKQLLHNDAAAAAAIPESVSP